MPGRKKLKNKEPEEVEVGTISEELEVPLASEVIFKKLWRIRNYRRLIAKREVLDSPIFRCCVNGVMTYWNIAVRFWKGKNGVKVLNPIVLCLNLNGCVTEERGQARIRFQFGVWDASIRHWECCPISSIIINLENSKELFSVGYKNFTVQDKHIDHEKDINIMIKIQVIQNEEERHSLSQDLARLLLDETEENTDTLIKCSYEGDEMPLKGHSFLIRARSPKLGNMLEKNIGAVENLKYQLDLSEVSYNLARELVRYIYTDKVDNRETLANKLLPLSIQFGLSGLSGLCERTLLESITPSNVANILLLADQCGCESLRKSALHYCEDSEEIKGNIHKEKTLAWRVMEMVNPDLFMEACESLGSSESTLDSSTSQKSYSE